MGDASEASRSTAGNPTPAPRRANPDPAARPCTRRLTTTPLPHRRSPPRHRTCLPVRRRMRRSWRRWLRRRGRATTVAPPFVLDPPPIAQPAAGGAPLDPLARNATQRAGVPDYTSGAGFADRLAGSPPPVASRSVPTASPATRDREALEAATAVAAATAVKRTRRGRPPKEPKTAGRRTRDWALNGTLVVAIAIVGAIAFSAFVWSPPEGEIPLPSGEPDAPGIVLGSIDPGGESPSFDPRAIGIIETADAAADRGRCRHRGRHRHRRTGWRPAPRPRHGHPGAAFHTDAWRRWRPHA